MPPKFLVSTLVPSQLDGHGVLRVEPDFNRNRLPYRITTVSGELYEYDMQLASSPPSEKTLQLQAQREAGESRGVTKPQASPKSPIPQELLRKQAQLLQLTIGRTLDTPTTSAVCIFAPDPPKVTHSTATLPAFSHSADTTAAS